MTVYFSKFNFSCYVISMFSKETTYTFIGLVIKIDHKLPEYLLLSLYT